MNTRWPLILFAWLVALVATLGALFIGEVMLMAPCQLCWYQRIFMFPLAIVLGMAAFTEDRRGAVYGLALSLAGGAIALYHTLLLAGWVPKTWVPCGPGPSCTDQKLLILGSVQIPWLSLAAFVAVIALLISCLRKTRP
ncbi:disulfide bond formation protein B [Variovorax paradoxus]|nr:disulfide bond formation protein B [Variovorax paradoxus]